MERPRTETRIMRAWQIHGYMRLHDGELAEFIVGVRGISPEPSARQGC
jgi:hypothetical protein